MSERGETRGEEGDGAGEGKEHLKSVRVDAAPQDSTALPLSDARSRRSAGDVAECTLSLISVGLQESAISIDEQARAAITEGVTVGVGNEGREGTHGFTRCVGRVEGRMVWVSDRLGAVRGIQNVIDCTRCRVDIEGGGSLDRG